MSKLKIGDKVEVDDANLASLRRIMNTGPNNEGTVHEIWDDGSILVCFPIGDEDPEVHSQVAPYPPHMVHLVQPQEPE